VFDILTILPPLLKECPTPQLSKLRNVLVPLSALFRLHWQVLQTASHLCMYPDEYFVLQL
jgi:hypothetical protein